MKKFLGILAVALGSMTSVFAGDVVTRDVSKLPAVALKAIQTNFPQTKISYIKIDKELLKKDAYEAVLTDGTELEFDANGKWTEVDCKKKVVPPAFIPAKIRMYMKTEFPNVKVTKIERDKRGYELELDNGLEAKFDWQGNFLRLKD